MTAPRHDHIGSLCTVPDCGEAHDPALDQEPGWTCSDCGHECPVPPAPVVTEAMAEAAADVIHKNVCDVSDDDYDTTAHAEIDLADARIALTAALAASPVETATDDEWLQHAHRLAKGRAVSNLVRGRTDDERDWLDMLALLDRIAASRPEGDNK